MQIEEMDNEELIRRYAELLIEIDTKHLTKKEFEKEFKKRFREGNLSKQCAI